MLSVTGMIDCAVVGLFFGANGLAAMKLAMPVFAVFELCSIVVGTGLAIRIPHDLARGERERADRTIRSSITILLLLAGVFMLLGAFCPGAVTALLAGSGAGAGAAGTAGAAGVAGGAGAASAAGTAGAASAAVLADATNYLIPILLAAAPILLYSVFAMTVMLEGGEKYIRIASFTILVADIIGDLLAVVLDGGIFGVAVASAIAYLLATLCIGLFYLRGHSMFRCLPGRISYETLWPVLVYGSPSAVVYLCDIVWPVAVNRLMLQYSTVEGLAALSIQDAVHYLPLAYCLGISGATVLLAGIYASEADREAARHLWKRILRWGIAGGVLISLVLGLLAPFFLPVFTRDSSVLALSVVSFRWYLAGVPFLAINLALVSYLQGLGKQGLSGSLAAVHHMVLPILLALLLGMRFGTVGIFASFGMCEIAMSAILLVLLLVSRQRSAAESGQSHQLKSEDGHTSQLEFESGQSRRAASKGHLFLPAESEQILDEMRMAIKTQDEAVEASQQVMRFCEKNGLDPRRSYQLALCAEELAVNSIQHGFNDGEAHHLELRTVLTEESLILRLRDDCRPFDILERYRIIQPVPEDPAANIGLRIVFAAASDVSYSSALRLNNVCVRIER